MCVCARWCFVQHICGCTLFFFVVSFIWCACGVFSLLSFTIIIELLLSFIYQNFNFVRKMLLKLSLFITFKWNETIRQFICNNLSFLRRFDCIFFFVSLVYCACTLRITLIKDLYRWHLGKNDILSVPDGCRGWASAKIFSAPAKLSRTHQFFVIWENKQWFLDILKIVRKLDVVKQVHDCSDKEIW